VGVAPCVGFVGVLDVVGVVTELVEELVVVVAVVIALVETLVEVFTELVVVARLLVVVVVVIVVVVVVVVVVVDWFIGCGSGCIAMYIEPWPFVVFTSPNHVRYSVLSMIDAPGTIVNAVV